MQISGHFGDPANVTLSAWVDLTTADTNGADFISLGDSVVLRFAEWSGGSVRGAYYDGSTWHELSFATNLVGAGWHHVAYSVDDTNNIHTIYLDGVAVDSAAMTGSVAYTLGPDTYLGTHGDGDTLWDFIGQMDDARIHDRALSAAEVTGIMNTPPGKDSDTLSITVDPVNDDPLHTVPVAQSIDEDTSLVLSSGNGNAVSVSDADGSPLEVTLTVTNGTVTLSNTIGPEFLANTTTTDAQNEPVIAMAADDSYVVAWTSKGQDDLDGKKGVYFQRYAADGTAQGIETLANQTTLEDQYAAAIAMDAAGNFVITWVSKAQDNVDGKNGVYARLFNADGTAATNEFLVNQTTLEDQVAPAVSMDNAGNFAIAWESKAQDNVDGKNGIYARLFNAAGTPTTGEFLVNQTTLEDQRAASIAMDADGDFVVAWQSKGQDDVDGKNGHLCPPVRCRRHRTDQRIPGQPDHAR